MNSSARKVLFLPFLLIPLFAAADDQEKVHKVLNKVTAMATDPSGKRSVSLAMSQCLSVTRPELLQRRQAMNLNYGDLFLAYQLVKTDRKIDDIAAKIKMGKTVWQAADEDHADWKQIAIEAKKLNSKIDTNLIGHFTKKKAEDERDRADGYDPSLDTVAADRNVSKEEIEDAAQRYAFVRDHSGAVSYASLDTFTEKATGRPDRISGGGAGTSVTTTATPKK
jgi:hypothetical protein